MLCLSTMCTIAVLTVFGNISDNIITKINGDDNSFGHLSGFIIKAE